MPPFTETGHAKNAANFLDLITICQGLGANYNPSKASIKITALQTLQSNALNSINAVTNKNTVYNNAVNARILAFKEIKHLATRLFNAIQTTDATDEMISNAKTINRKIQGKRAKTITPPTTPPLPSATVPKTISVSQQSYDQQIEHFNTMVELLKSEPSYTPNEADLKITALTIYYTKLIATNTAVATAYTALSNARITRDKALYLSTTGIIDVAQGVKKYIKSIFGATSPEYKQVSGIKFTKRKI